MKMLLDDAPGLNLISACEADGVIIQGQRHAFSLVIYPRTIDNNWTVESIAQLTPESLTSVVAQAPEVLILGTGVRQQFPAPQQLAPLINASIGYEIMDNRAACRTFNILLGEGRNAALILLN